MTVCDRCEGTQGVTNVELVEVRGSVNSTPWKSEGFDLCATCYESLVQTIAEFLKPLPKEAPKPKRKK